jgi:hypothetical protein
MGGGGGAALWDFQSHRDQPQDRPGRMVETALRATSPHHSHVRLVFRMKIRLRCMRRRRPDPRQLLLCFMLVADGATTPPVARGRVRQPERRIVPSWRPRRSPGERGASPARREWQTTRWIGRHATCVVCGSWPASHDHVVLGRLLLTCAACASKPNTLTRLREIVSQDWRPEPTMMTNG